MIEQKILSGYWYRTKSSPSLQTGQGGALLLIKTFREEGLPDSLIEDSIQVFTDDHGWVSLSQLVIKKKNDN